MWTNLTEAIAAVVTGAPLSRQHVNALRWGSYDSSHTHRFLNARALAANGEARKARNVLDELHHAEAEPTRFSYALGCAALALQADEVTVASELLSDALELAQKYPWPEYQVDLLELLAVVASRHGDHDRAARLVGAAKRGRVEIRMGYRFADQQAWLDAAAAAGGAAWATGVSEGQRLSLPEAVAYGARGRGRRHRPTAGWDSLTPTEAEVVKLVAQGLTNQQIAERLLTSVPTVKTHVHHAFTKLDVSTRSELAAAVTRRTRRA
jgi:DNA-binding CsgD family transcriptional regulator